MAKTASTRVGSGIPGFGDSEGAERRNFKKLDGEFKVEIIECLESPNKKNPKNTNVRLRTTILGGPEQADGSDMEGKEVSWFLNVDPDLVNDNGKRFTVDQYKSVYLAAGVKTTGNQPEPKKLAGKTIAIQAWESKPDEKGTTYQRWAAVSLAESKTFAED